MSRPTPIHGVFCNRTLNLRSIAAIGYDMDYTLIHYRVEHWERKAYEHIRAKLQELGWPVQSLEFDPGAMVRGLVVDTKLGNVVKADRFGYVKRAVHGAGVLDFDIQRKNYARTAVDLSENRWKFLNTLFSLSGACMYSQLVELLDRGELPGAIGYDELYDVLSSSLNAAHMEGLLKKEIMEAPEKFVDSDPDTVLTLLDQRNAGKKLLLITNSEWNYTKEMMEFAFDRHLPNELTWRDIFDVIIVGARKPAFFSDANPFFEVVSPEGLLQPAVGGLKPGGVFLGGNAEEVERYIGVSGDSILYVGDHMFSDVKVTKNLLRWRTALIVRELEDEIAAVQEFSTTNEKLNDLMAQKEELEFRLSELRVSVQRAKKGYGPEAGRSIKELESESGKIRRRLVELDTKIAPLAEASGSLGHKTWGPWMRAGNDKSHLARQVERHADVYMSRVANMLAYTPFAYFRSPRGSLPHDP